MGATSRRKLGRSEGLGVEDGGEVVGVQEGVEAVGVVFGKGFYRRSEFFIERGDKCGWFIVGGWDFELIGMEGQSLDERGFGFAFFEAKVGFEVGKHYRSGWAVKWVYGEWQLYAFEMYADLMCSAGYRLDSE